MGNTHSADSAYGHPQVRPSSQVPAELGPPEGESKWVLAGIVVGHKNWCNLVKSGNTGIDRMKGEDDDYRNSRPEMSDHKLAIAVVLDAGIADCIVGGLVDWIVCRRNNPCLLFCSSS